MTENGIPTPKISLIIPCYNQESYIRECIDSILGQSYKDFEIIAVDDGSTDKTPIILHEYESLDSRVRVIEEKNLSAGAARNNGIPHARGEFILFMDSDDFLAEGALALLAAATEKECADMYFFSYSTYDNESGRIEKKPQFSRLVSHFTYGEGELFYRMTSFERERREFMWSSVVPWNKLYRKSFITENGLKYDEFFSTNDRTFYFASILAAGKIMLLDAFPIFYRVNNYHSSTGHYNKKRFINRCAAYESSKKLFESAPEQLADLFFSVAISDFITFLLKAKDNRFELFLDTVRYFRTIEARGERTSWLKWYEFIAESDYLEGREESSVVPVAMTVNNYSVKHAAVTVESVRAHRSPEKLYDIYLFYTDLKERNLRLISSLGGEGVSVRAVKLDAVFDHGIRGLKRYENKLLYLPAIARILRHYERLIYLTYNDIAGADIAEVLTVDMPGALFAVSDKGAALDSASSTDGVIYEERANPNMLVIKTEPFAALPTVVGGERAVLSNETEFLNTVLESFISYLPDNLNRQSQGDERETEDYVILSYNRIKPWASKEFVYADDYWRYARRSPSYEDILREYFSYKLARPKRVSEPTSESTRGESVIRVLSWPIRMTVAFFRSMRRYGAAVTFASVRRKLRFVFGRLFGKNKD